jgi:hypothetical protein
MTLKLPLTVMEEENQDLITRLSDSVWLRYRKIEELAELITARQ